MRLPYILAIAVLGASVAPAVGAVELIANGSFEATSTYASPGSSGAYAYPPGTHDSWTYSAAGLINGATASAWFGNTPPSGYTGTQYAFVQNNGTLSQTFVAKTSGKLSISWLEGGRPEAIYHNYGGDQTYSVLVDGVSFGTFSSVGGENFMSRSIDATTVLAGSSHTLTFAAMKTTGDNTVFIDSVGGTVLAVPEPASWMLMIAGFGLVGLRRRKSTAACA